jgi:hypothetical protein
MGRRDDVMERLGAADPLPDGERLTSDEQREADALLARILATPPAPEQRPRPQTAPRRCTLVAVGAACSLLVAFAAVNLLDSENSPAPNVIARAVAAVSADEAVYHVLDRRRVRASDFPGNNGAAYFESWHTTDGSRHEKVFADGHGRPGKLLGELAGRRAPGRRGGPMVRWDARANTIYSGRFGTLPGNRGAPSLDPNSDPGATLRALEDQGRLRLDGTVDVDGRRAYRLVSGTVPSKFRGSRESVEFLVDADTYLPLASRFVERARPGHRYELIIRYLVYKRLPLDARSRAKLDLDPHPGAKCALGADETMGRGSLGFPNPCAR